MVLPSSTASALLLLDHALVAQLVLASLETPLTLGLLSLKMRLYDALRKMPSMNSHHRKQHGSSASIVGQVSVLAKANREIHICSF